MRSLNNLPVRRAIPLGYMPEDELCEGHCKRVELDLGLARVPAVERPTGFDFAAKLGLARRMVDELATRRMPSESRNIVLLGPTGVGKLRPPIALGV